MFGIGNAILGITNGMWRFFDRVSGSIVEIYLWYVEGTVIGARYVLASSASSVITRGGERRAA